MERLHELRRRLAFLFRRRQFECDLEEEMRFHLEMKARETGAAAARRQFGNMTLLREDSRAAWGWAWLEALARDLRYGMRLYRRSPGFTAVAVLTLGLGLGVNIAIFMLLYNVILRPLPYPQPDRLVKVYVTFLSDQRGARDIGFSYPKFQDLQRLTSSFQSLAAYGRGTFDLADHPAERVRGEFVSSAYFRTLGVPAALGRTFLPQEDAVLRGRGRGDCRQPVETAVRRGPRRARERNSRRDRFHEHRRRSAAGLYRRNRPRRVVAAHHHGAARRQVG